jgi:hypothetical protein
MTSIQIISFSAYKEQYANKTDSLMSPDEWYWYDCSHYVDKKQLRKNIKDRLPKGARIMGVIIPTQDNPCFKNVENKSIPYRTPLCASINQDGAYIDKYGRYVSDYPIGDAIVIINK